MKTIDEICKDTIKNGVKDFAVFEDNGGGLHLSIWYDDDFYCHCGYEYNHGQLIEDLTELSNGNHPRYWDNMRDMTQEEWLDMVRQPYGGNIILDGSGLSDKLGVAGRIEFLDFRRYGLTQRLPY